MVGKGWNKLKTDGKMGMGEYGRFGEKSVNGLEVRMVGKTWRPARKDTTRKSESIVRK